MEIPAGAQHPFANSLLLSASILVLWVPQGSWAALRIQKIPEQPQRNQNLLLSVQGVPDTIQDFSWYLGKEADGSTRLFTYIPGLQRPQRDGNAMNRRDIVGFANGSMLLRHAQSNDSGTYQVAVTINPSWTMRAKTEVQVVEKHKEQPITSLPMNAGIVAAIIIGSLAIGCVFVAITAYLLVTRGWRVQSHRITATEKPELDPSHHAGDNNIYEVLPSPVLLVSPLSDTGSTNAIMPPNLPLPPPPPLENQPYQDLLNPDPAPYCQLVPAP
ncbi:carcinoembryonic antigen-related cell adhesion molecule 19 isoform X3 [Hippopotamus amphibius kiboko]|uniref:carcinoembryonic antigen-related cell adhesion molecule 19 isoform X3 n=1 Tax=Hippopotamus amphibius kiboko TaxID=575201 RepID=UPI00259A9DF9|nr:carcinoembryonic antigen-related cell adhesion molecule 19 isoform X3 [Hippopotamus amphibius kiboko]